MVLYNDNPSLCGWLLEMWFFAKLRHHGFDFFDLEGDRKTSGHWEKSDIRQFDPKNISNAIVSAKDVWLKPIKWCQGGYDAVHLSNTTVAFVQVTKAQSHKIKLVYMQTLLAALIIKKRKIGVTLYMCWYYTVHVLVLHCTCVGVTLYMCWYYAVHVLVLRCTCVGVTLYMCLLHCTCVGVTLYMCWYYTVHVLVLHCTCVGVTLYMCWYYTVHVLVLTVHLLVLHVHVLVLHCTCVGVALCMCWCYMCMCWCYTAHVLVLHCTCAGVTLYMC